MGTLRIAEHAKNRHSRLIDQVRPLTLADDRDHACHIVDPLDGDIPHRRNDRKVVLCHQSEAGLRMTGPNHCELTYDAEQPRMAAPAFLAASAFAGAPVAGDEGMIALLTLARQVALSNIPVLVEGPTGTGKEVLARYLHDSSERRDGPFVAINCAAMPEAMLEAMLFGHRKGAFTGASEAQEGFFRAADGGTLLLDEIGEMPIALQAKLLRALQEGEVVPLGATQPVSVDVRVVACTNRELPEEIKAGRFREDLYYRLNVFPLRIPALRERPGDITPLAFAMLLKHGEVSGMPRWISEDAIQLLASHNWPGNVRELENVMRRAMLLAGKQSTISASHIRFDQAVRALEPEASDAPKARGAADDASLSDIAFRSESEAILRTLEECSGRRGETARRLGISERTLRYRLANMRDAGLAIAGGRS